MAVVLTDSGDGYGGGYGAGYGFGYGDGRGYGCGGGCGYGYGYGDGAGHGGGAATLVVCGHVITCDVSAPSHWAAYFEELAELDRVVAA